MAASLRCTRVAYRHRGKWETKAPLSLHPSAGVPLAVANAPALHVLGHRRLHAVGRALPRVLIGGRLHDVDPRVASASLVPVRGAALRLSHGRSRAAREHDAGKQNESHGASITGTNRAMFRRSVSFPDKFCPLRVNVCFALRPLLNVGPRILLRTKAECQADSVWGYVESSICLGPTNPRLLAGQSGGNEKRARSPFSETKPICDERPIPFKGSAPARMPAST